MWSLSQNSAPWKQTRLSKITTYFPRSEHPIGDVLGLLHFDIAFDNPKVTNHRVQEKYPTRCVWNIHNYATFRNQEYISWDSFHIKKTQTQEAGGAGLNQIQLRTRQSLVIDQPNTICEQFTTDTSVPALSALPLLRLGGFARLLLFLGSFHASGVTLHPWVDHLDLCTLFLRTRGSLAGNNVHLGRDVGFRTLLHGLLHCFQLLPLRHVCESKKTR